MFQKVKKKRSAHHSKNGQTYAFFQRWTMMTPTAIVQSSSQTATRICQEASLFGVGMTLYFSLLLILFVYSKLNDTHAKKVTGMKMI